MNHVYRVIYNRVLGCWQAVTELAKSSGKLGGAIKRSTTRQCKRPLERHFKPTFNQHAAQLATLAALVAASSLGSGMAAAQSAPAHNQLPQGGNVAAGQANINASGNVMNIDQATQKAIINWQEFNVGKDATVNFNQPGSDSATLNRVLDANPSQIFGRIVAPGQVILINPNGAYFAPSASVDVGGLIATTHELADKDFLDGNYQFKRNGATGKIINEGELKAKLDGYIALMAPEVRNQGVIVAERGTVALASGEHIQLDFGTGNKLQGITVTEQDFDAQIENKHAIIAKGGLVILSARATAELRASVIKNSGQIVASAGANTVTKKGGRIILEGNTIEVTQGSELIATGPKGGGEILVGGDWQGGQNAERRVFEDPKAVHQAKTVTVETNTKIDASATDNGDGGTVVVWSDVKNPESVTTVQGEILAKGGENGGDGGQIETSGRQLIVDGVSVSTLAADGSAGDWLLDPGNIEIRDSGTSSGGTTVILTSTIENNLSSNDVIIKTDTDNVYYLHAYDLIQYGGSAERTLTLGASGRVLIYADITSTDGPLNLVLASSIDRTTNFTSAGYGVGLIGPVTINTKGGDLWIGGGKLDGSWKGHEVGVGAAMGGVPHSNGLGAEIRNSTILTGGGDVRILGTSNGAPGISAFQGDTTINVGTGDIELISDRMGFDYGDIGTQIQIDGTGNLTIAPLENSFANAVKWDASKSGDYYTSTGGANTIDGLKIQDTLGLTIGKPGNSALLYIETDIVINGPISFESGGFTTQSGVDLETTAKNAGILVKVNEYPAGSNPTDGYISIAGDNITTDGGDIVLWTNTSNRTSGQANNEISLEGSNTLTSNGGKIVLAGGEDSDDDGIPDGYAYRGGLGWSAVVIGDNVSLLSDGGDVIIRGQAGLEGPSEAPRSFGVQAGAGFKLDSDAGTINIKGLSASESGIWLGPTDPAGAVSPIAITSASTAATAITIHGESTSTTGGHGFIANWDGLTGSHVLIQSSGASGGGVSITGITNGTLDGILLGKTGTNESIQILSQAGDVSLISNEGLYIGNDAFLGNRKDANAVNGITPSVQSSSADILIRANSFNVGSAIDVSAAGELTIEPYDNSFSSAYSTSDLTLGFALTGLTIGKSTNTANVTIDSAIDIAGPLTVYGPLTLASDITTSGAQEYNGAVTIGSAVVNLSTVGNGATGSTITFTDNIDGTTANANSLFMLSGAGAISVAGSVGGTEALNYLGLGGVGQDLSGTTFDFAYTGAAETFSKSYDGTYQLEVWGAAGGGAGSPGAGGYAEGEISIASGESLYIYVGGAGTGTTGGWNGGGTGGIDTPTPGGQDGGGGGGATDIRTSTNLDSRVLVAGGGGGTGRSGSSAGGVGGGASGTAGANESTSGFGGGGGTQTAGGSVYNTNNGASAGSLGSGGNGSTDWDAGGGGGGGGGYYGGGGGIALVCHTCSPGGFAGGGGGGSSYIGGVTNGSTTAGNASMPNGSGGTMTGNAGNGFARITVLEATVFTAGTQTGEISITGEVDVSSIEAAPGAYDINLATSTGNVSIGSDAQFKNTGNLQLGSISGSQSVTVTGALTSTAPSIVKLGADITTTTTQSYSAAELLKTVTLNTTNSTVSFSGAVNSQTDQAHELTVNAGSGAITLNDVGVTANAALGAMTLNGTGTRTLNGDATINGPIEIHGSDISINGALSATDGASSPTLSDINLHASGNVTQTASITAAGLGLHGTGSFTLTNTSNSVATLAGGDSTTKLGSLDFVNAGALEIGSVNPTGITASGNVAISTEQGDLTISEKIATDSTGSSAIVLNAGSNSAAGTSTGGNIVVSGTPSLTTGTGGRVLLFTGSISGSTGVAESSASAGDGLVEYGSGNFRYNADENTTFGTGGLTDFGTSGAYAIYREQPTVSGTISSGTITYGDATPTFSLSGGDGPVNGDTVTFAVQSPSESTSGNLIVGNYVVKQTNLAGLGYATSITDGQLTVDKKTLNIAGLTVNSRAYNGTQNTTLSGTPTLVGGGSISTDGKYLTGDTVSLTGTESGQFDTANAGTGKTVTISGLSLTGGDSTNYSLNNDLTGDINRKTVSLSASKTYDGTNDLTGDVTITTGVGDETLTYSGATASSDQVATANKYINAITLADGDNGGIASNYQTPDLTQYSSGSNSVTITARTLTLSYTGNNKVYDGKVTASVTVGDNRVEGDVLTITPTASFENKNVDTDKPVSITNVVLGGTDVNNYTLASTTGSTTANITRLSSVTWIGGTTGDWFNPGNWASTGDQSITGTVPDLSNVVNVVIPDGVTVTFDNNATTPATAASTAANAVNIDSLGTSGSLKQDEGFLNVGDGGITLNTLTQNGGTLTNTGSTTLSTYSQTGGSFTGASMTADSFNQTSGSTSLTGDLTVNTDYSQTGDGTVTVGGNTSITDTSGGMTLGNLDTTGTTTLVSRAGAIEQTIGTKLTSDGAATITASDGQQEPSFFDITLLNEENDFKGTVTASGKDVKIRDVNDLDADVTATGDTELQAGGSLSSVLAVTGNSTLTSGGNTTVSGTSNDLTTNSGGTTSFGETTLSGKLDATSEGNISQTGKLIVEGTAGITSTAGDIILLDDNNDFKGTVTASGKDVKIRDVNDLDADITTSGVGNLQAGGILSAVLAVTGNSTLTSGGNTTVSGTSNDLTTNSGGTTSFGETTLAGKLDATSEGNISQTGKLIVEGTAGITSTAGDITLLNENNDFKDTVTASGKDVKIRDVNDLDADVTATGDTELQAGGSLSSVLAVTGNSTLTSDGNMTVSGTSNDLATNSGGTTSFGQTTLAGQLDSTSDGDVTQTGKLVVAGTSGITSTSADIVLDRSDNDFIGPLTVFGRNIFLTDLNNLTLAQATATANLTVATGGNLVFGPTTVGGDLSATTAGGSITQTGPIFVLGKVTFNAGNGSIDLSDPDNYFPSGVDARGSSIVIAGDSNAVASQASAGVFYQEVSTAESVDVRVTYSFTTGSSSNDVLVISQADAQEIETSLCMSAPVSAALTCK